MKHEASKIINNQLLVVEYGLTAFSGQKPYFSITGDLYRGIVRSRNPEMSGCLHDLIAEHFPEMADLIALHLSDIDGVPIHAIENGYYWLTAVQGENKYETGRDKDFLGIFASYMRISRSDACILADRITDKVQFSQWVDTQRARWKDEAAAAIKKYHLKV